MREGDVVLVDFGIPAGSEAGFVRPAVVVSPDRTLEADPPTLHVIPVTTNTRRSFWADVPVEERCFERPSVAQVHLCTVIGRPRIVDDGAGAVDRATLAQLRSVLRDVLDLP